MEKTMSYPYFPAHEIQCKCGCGEQEMSPDFMHKLIVIRKQLQTPLYITSGYRCPVHNDRVSGTGEGGPHTTGRAVDISATGRLKYQIMEAAQAQGMTRFGIGKNFIHIDDLESGFSDRVIWSY